MTQDTIFLQSEGNAYCERNRDKITVESALQDYPMQLLREAGIKPTKVVDIGTSMGHRLEAIRRTYENCECVGIEPSEQAIVEGSKLFPKLNFRRGTADMLPVASATADLVTCAYTMHWWPREKLLQSFAEVDRILKPEGHLLIVDFYPDYPIKVPYRHKAGLWTYKMRYHDWLVQSGLYSLVSEVVFDDDTHEIPTEGWLVVPEQRRAFCALLKKTDGYAEVRLEDND